MRDGKNEGDINLGILSHDSSWAEFYMHTVAFRKDPIFKKTFEILASQ